MAIELAKEGQEIQLLPLCQSQSLLLRPGGLYRFYIQEGCEACSTLQVHVAEAYGELHADLTNYQSTATSRIGNHLKMHAGAKIKSP